MKRVLVTGASGFIGRHCITPLVASGFEVHAVSSGGRHDPSSSVVWHGADLFEPDRVSDLLEVVQPSHLLHLAWYVEPGKLAESIENYRWVQASLELVRRFREHGGRRVVCAGSGFEYDWGRGRCSERETPLAPKTFYGTCKRTLGELLEAYAGRVELSLAWARIFFVYGPHEHPRRLISSVTRSLLLGEEARCSHGRQIRDFLHVQDVADALVAVVESGLEGPINVASGEGVTLASVVERIAHRIGRPELLRLGAIPARAGEAPEVVADTSRLVGELGWKPRYHLDRGLDHTIKWWETAVMREMELEA